MTDQTVSQFLFAQLSTSQIYNTLLKAVQTANYAVLAFLVEQKLTFVSYPELVSAEIRDSTVLVLKSQDQRLIDLYLQIRQPTEMLDDNLDKTWNLLFSSKRSNFY